VRWTLLTIALTAVVAGSWAAIVARRGREDLGRQEAGCDVLRDARKYWPPLLLAVLVAASFFAPGSTSIDAPGIEGLRRVVAATSLTVLAWQSFEAWRFLRRGKHLGALVASLPRFGSPPASLHYGVAAFMVLLLCSEAYLWLTYGRPFEWSAGIWIAMGVQNLILARARTEIRADGFWIGLHGKRWDTVRGWRWQTSGPQPVLVLDVGGSSPLALSVPEAQQPSVLVELDGALRRECALRGALTRGGARQPRASPSRRATSSAICEATASASPVASMRAM